MRINADTITLSQSGRYFGAGDDCIFADLVTWLGGVINFNSAVVVKNIVFNEPIFSSRYE
jgi:hypothetical protein